MSILAFQDQPQSHRIALGTFTDQGVGVPVPVMALHGTWVIMA
jgi:hypothetical protein